MSPRPLVRFLDRTTPPHIVTLVTLAGINAMSMNIFLPSLPAMATYFGTDYAVMQLSVSLYLVANAVLQIFVGPISDRYGRRPVMLGATAIFLLATVGTLFAQSIEVFLVFRALQAVIATGLVMSRAVVRDMVPQEEAASMLGYVTMGMAIVPMVAPTVGGLLEEVWGWQASFVMLLVAGSGVLWLSWADQGETALNKSASFSQQFRQYPELFASRRFWGYCATVAFSSGAFFSFLGGAPYVGSQVYGLSPSGLGAYFACPAVGYAAGNFLSGRYSVRVGINRLALAGAVITVAAMAALVVVELAGFKSPTIFFGFVGIMGIGNGLVMPNGTAGMLSVRPHLAGTASGLGGTIMIGGGAAFSALAGVLLSRGEGDLPLVLLMLAATAASVVTILYVIRRERRVGLA